MAFAAGLQPLMLTCLGIGNFPWQNVFFRKSVGVFSAFALGMQQQFCPSVYLAVTVRYFSILIKTLVGFFNKKTIFHSIKLMALLVAAG